MSNSTDSISRPSAQHPTRLSLSVQKCTCLVRPFHFLRLSSKIEEFIRLRQYFTMNRIIILLTLIAQQKAAHVHLVPNNVKTKNVTGELTLVQCEDNLIEITGKVYGLTPGLHGIHVHEKGDLRDGCMSTGPHFNPENVTHGGQNSPVRHVGDLGNILANESGVADVNIKDSIISFTGNNNIIGRAIVIHSGEDDLGRGSSPLSASTGNSGDRWACGIIKAE